MIKIRFYTILLGSGAVVLLIGLLWLVNAVEPNKIAFVALFYLLAASIVFALTTLVGLYLRKILGQRELQNLYFKTAARQGLWLAILVVVSLALSSLKLFSWLNASFLVLALVFFESYLLVSNKNN